MPNSAIFTAGSDAKAGALLCELETTFPVIAQRCDEWDEFVQIVGGDIYLTSDWCRLWWAHYAGGRQLRIYTLRSEGRLVGVLPMFIDRVWLGPVWLRIAKVVGGDSSLTICNPPVHPEWATAIFERVLHELICTESCDAVWFGPMGGTYQQLESIRQACGTQARQLRIVRDSVQGVHTAFDVPQTVDAYLASLAKKKRSNYRRQLRMLESDHKITMDVVSDPKACAEEFKTFLTLHEQQWKAQGKLGHFGDWPGAVDFNVALVRAMGAAGHLRLLRVLADGRPISYHYGYVFGRCYYWRFAARAIGPKWDEYGLGNLGIVQKMEMSVKEGVTHVEAGIGHYDYKLQWGGKEYPLHSILVVANRLGARLRAKLFIRLADLLHLFYYRIWFLRLAPKFRRRPRSLWRIWIRSRL